MRLESGVGWSELWSRDIGGESTSKLIAVVGRVQFLGAVILRFLLPCWLLAGGLF